MTDNNYQHWHLAVDEDNILWLTFDRQGASVNTMSREVFAELGRVIDEIASKNPRPSGVVILSGKKKGFIAGADITQFTDLKTTQDGYELCRTSQQVLDKLEALPMPVVAMIDGFCLGGGTELALACHYRVAKDSADTRIGLPEILLGIQPGWGGTVRLPRLVGVIEAMKMILPGASYHAKKCAKIGIIDVAVPERNLKSAARYYIKHRPKRQRPKGWDKYVNAAWARKLLGKTFYKKLTDKHVNRDHYPAPYAVVDAWIRDGAKGEIAYVNEAKSIAELMITPTARNLVRAFFLQTKMKDLAKGIDFKPAHVHVIGGGTMGGDIAAWCAYKGLYVTLQDVSPERIAQALKRAYQLFKKKYRREERLITAAMDRLQPDVEGLGVARADVIIEAVFEDLAVKQKIFADIEQKAKHDAILATNTSSIPLQEIATAMQNPERLVGIHFFNPVAKMQLVEVVRSPQTAKQVLDSAIAFVNKISRYPLPVASRPGFLVNRVLMPYLMEAMALYQEGVPAEVIDRAATGFGMLMGPITLADKVGLDICLHVAENLTAQFGGTVPEHLKQMVANGDLGVKSAKGFYSYQKGKKMKAEPKFAEKVDPDIADRLVLRMVNEAVACLHEGVIDNPDLLDAGMIYGTGFAPFRGGPINYAKERGFQAVVNRLEEFENRYGERFQPMAGWNELMGAAPSKPVEKEIESTVPVNNAKQNKTLSGLTTDE